LFTRTCRCPFSVTVSFADYPPPFLLKTKNYRLRLDLYVNDITYQRMLTALNRWERAAGRLVHLRRVLLGQKKPVFELPEEEVAFFNTDLNPSQREAVRWSLGARDVMLIHGPPGTGKTMTVIELARQLIARGETVLAAADSNTAVDNLVERLAAQGVRVVRVGHPTRVSPLLRQHTLDYLLMAFPNREFYDGLLAAHPSIAGRTLADLLPAGKPEPGLPAALAGALDPGHPLAFIDIKGEEGQRPGSPSRENRREAEVISLLARSFLDLGLGGLIPAHLYPQGLTQAPEGNQHPPLLETRAVSKVRGRSSNSTVTGGWATAGWAMITNSKTEIMPTYAAFISRVSSCSLQR